MCSHLKKRNTILYAQDEIKFTAVSKISFPTPMICLLAFYAWHQGSTHFSQLTLNKICIHHVSSLYKTIQAHPSTSKQQTGAGVGKLSPLVKSFQKTLIHKALLGAHHIHHLHILCGCSVLQRPSWRAASRTIWPGMPKIFTVSSLKRMFAEPGSGRVIARIKELERWPLVSEQQQLKWACPVESQNCLRRVRERAD